MKLGPRILPTVVIIVALAHDCAEAWAAYRFVQVADSTTSAPAGTFSSFDHEPALSNGEVAFQGFYQSESGIFIGDGIGLSTLIKEGDPAPTGVFTNLDQPSISSGTIAFAARNSLASGGVYSLSGGTLITVAEFGDSAPWGSFFELRGSPGISGGTVVFRGSSGFRVEEGIFIGNGGSLTTIAKTGDAAHTGVFATQGFGSRPVIDGDAVAFRGSYDVGARRDTGVFIWQNETIVKVAQEGDAIPDGTLTGVSEPSISGGYTVFRASYTGGSGIFKGNGGSLTVVAKRGDLTSNGTLDAFGFFPSIAGDSVAFVASYSGGEGIFLGNGGPVTTVVARGDVLFGSTAADLNMGHFRLDPDRSGRIAFHYELTDGRTGIAIAVPVPEPNPLVFLGLRNGSKITW